MPGRFFCGWGGSRRRGTRGSEGAAKVDGGQGGEEGGLHFAEVGEGCFGGAA